MMKIGSPEKSYPVKRLPGVVRLLQKLAWLRLLTARNGNTLLYIVVVMVIFGFLGVTMVTLFTTSSVSSATRNDTRRAVYLAESGARYAAGELINNGFSQDVINRFNVPTTYTVSGAGTFTVNVFGPWFESLSQQKSVTNLDLYVPDGRLPQSFAIPVSPPNVMVVNARYFGVPVDQARALITGSTRTDDKNLSVSLASAFTVESGEEVVLAINPSAGQGSVTQNGSLFVPMAAKDIFPPRNGAIEIAPVPLSVTKNYYTYDERADDTANNRVELKHISLIDPNESWADIDVSDSAHTYVILSQLNHSIVPTATSGSVSTELEPSQIVNVSSSPEQMEHNSEINVTEEAKGNPTVIGGPKTTAQEISVNPTTGELNVGNAVSNAFGAAWYVGSKTVGGDPDFCVDGKCSFHYGVRVFFTLKYSGTGQGFVFTLVNAENNGLTSIGGDGDAPELLAYAGDSHYSGGYLDGAGGKGLQPPKIGVEFDAQPNNSEPLYCSDSTLNTGTRDDPLTGSQDAVQYVFWGRNDSLYIPCRDNDVTYDDNKHNAHGSTVTKLWEYNLGADPGLWRPAVASDGTVYVSVMNGTLRAVTRDGTSKWTHSLGNNAVYNPGIDPLDGTIYVDYADYRIDYVNPDGSDKLPPISIGDDFDSTPVVGPDGRIYFGTNGSRVLRYSRSGNFVTEYRDATGTGEVDGNVAFGPDGTVYFSAWGNTYGIRGALWAFQPGGTKKWNYPILEANSGPNSAKVLSSPAVSRDGSTIYVGSNDDYLYAINSNGTLKWRHFASGDVESSPVVASDGTIIFGSDTGHVSALIDSGTASPYKWDYPTFDAVVSSPIIDPNDGTIYVGSNDDKLYALNPYIAQLIWQFPTGADIRSSPAIGPDGTIYVASNDDKLYALQAFAKPRNYKIDPLESGNTEKYLVTADDLDATLLFPENWLTEGPWAVRIEVLRATTPNTNGNYEYTMRTWLRQCNDENCTTDNSLNKLKGTFFEDTRIQYDAQEPQLVQTIELTPAEHVQFERFLFGFTTASGSGEDQSAVIGDYQLSFIRPNDPVVHSDPNWP